MGKYQDLISKNYPIPSAFVDFVEHIIYIVACVATCGLVYLIRIIIKHGMADSYDTLIGLHAVTKDIDIEVGKIKEEVSKIKSEIEDIKRA